LFNVSLPFATTTPNFNFFQRTRPRFPFTCANQNQGCSNFIFLKPKLEALHKSKELPNTQTLGCILIGA